MSADLRPMFHPAGFDAELRPVLDDVRVGRWRSMRDLLDVRRTSTWALRTARSQVLAAAAATGDAVQAWAQEEPDPNALMMLARVAVQRALNARGRKREVGRLADRARAVCQDAVRCWPEDPVPWVGLLALAQLDSPVVGQRRPEHRGGPWEYMLPRGPWGLLAEVHRRDGGNREAWHRMLQALQAYQVGVSDFVRWVSSWAPEGSPLVVLPLYVYADFYGERRARGVLTPVFWNSASVSHHAHRALESWFAHADRASWSALDLNHLAQALYSGGFREEAAGVFEVIGPFATPVPWRYVADKPERWLEEFVRARRHCLPDPVERLQAGSSR